MSSGVEAEVALDTAVVLGLGMTRVVGGTAGLAAVGAGALASMADARAEERAAALRRARRYEAAIVDVLDVNARIAALATSIRRARSDHGASVDLVAPAPLPLTGQPIEELTRWRAATSSTLDDAEREVAAALAAAVTRTLFPSHGATLRSDLGEATLDGPDDQAGSTEFTSTGSTGTGSTATGSTGTAASSTDAGAVWRSGTGAAVARLLGRLLPGATDQDHAYVTTAAKQVADASTPGEAEGRLTELRIRIQQANTRTKERRDGAAAAARFLRELDTVAAESATPAPDPAAPGHGAGLTACRAQLTDVVEGNRPLTDRLRDSATRLLEEAQTRAERQYVVDAITTAFGEMGYEVSEGFETLTARDGDVVLTRGDWPQHAVKLKVDTDSPTARRAGGDRAARTGHRQMPGSRTAAPDAAPTSMPASTLATSDFGAAPIGEVRLAMVRTEPAADADDRRRDVEREREWCDSFEVAKERLAEAGIRANVSHRIEPGAHPIPVDARSRRSGRARPAEHQRKRER